MKYQLNIVINRPVEAVWAYISNFDNLPTWLTATIETRLTSEPPIRKGTTYIWIGQHFGQRSESASEVTEYEPNRAWAYKSISDSMEVAARYSVEPVNCGTRMTMNGEGKMRGFLRLVEPIIGVLLLRQLKTSTVLLKNALESQETRATTP